MKKLLFIIGLFISLNGYSQIFESSKDYPLKYNITEECDSCYCRVPEWHQKKMENWRYIKNSNGYRYTKCYYYVYWFEWVNYSICDENFPL